MNQKIKIFIKSTLVLALVALSLQAGAKWFPPAPGIVPTDGNIPMPLNVGGVAQTKQGSLLVYGFKSFGPAQFDSSIQIKQNAGDGLVLTSDINGNATWQAASGGITGGTVDYIPRFASSTTLTRSTIWQGPSGVGSPYSGRIGIGTTEPGKLATGEIVPVKLGVFSDAMINTLTVGTGGGGIPSNSVLGYKAMFDNTTGVNNSAFGNLALTNNISGSRNTAVGYNSQKYSDANDTTAVGYRALYNVGCAADYSGNTAIGSNAGNLNSGANNTYLGKGTGISGTSICGLPVNNSTLVGYGATTSEPNTMVFGNTDVATNVFHGKIGIGGIRTPSAFISIPASAGQPNTAPIKFVSNASSKLLTTPESGAMEYDGKHLFFTVQESGGPKRYQLDQQGSGSGTGTIKLTGDVTGESTSPVDTVISNGAVNSAKLADDAVTIAKIAAPSPSADKILGINSLGTALEWKTPAVGTGAGSDTWELSGTDPVVYLKDAGNNVGIGTSSPLNQLEITKSFGMPDTAIINNSLVGVINKNNKRFLHNFGTDNTFLGTNSGNFSMSGARNVAIGTNTLKANTSGQENVVIGYGASDATTVGSNNVVIGNNALGGATGGNGNFNTIVGWQAASTGSAISSTTAIGYQALIALTTGSGNTAVGHLALSGVQSGSWNVGLGTNALQFVGSGNSNTAIGYNAGPSGNFTNTTSVGYGAAANASNQIRIGNGDVSFIGGQVPWSPASDFRLKKDIVGSDLGLDFIMKLRPVSYKYINGDGGTDYGFIAQEVEEAVGKKTNIVLTDGSKEGMKYMRYDDLIAPSVKAIQELKKENDTLSARLEALEVKLK